MIPRVDWISYTSLVGVSPIPIGPTYVQRQLSKAIEQSPPLLQYIIATSDFKELSGKNFYRHRLSRVGGGMEIYSSPDREDLSIELTGVGCALADDNERMRATVEQIADRLTRLDLAADFLCDVSPFTFAHHRTYNRVRRIATVQSDTGEWIELGSRTSDHSCVVYRYAPPHPRADYLRTEVRFKREQAKVAGRQLAANNVAWAVEAANNFYGWTHPIWTDRKTHDDQLSGWQPDRGDPDAIRWLLTQVLPAIERLESEGIITDSRQFMADHLWKEKENPYVRA